MFFMLPISPFQGNKGQNWTDQIQLSWSPKWSAFFFVKLERFCSRFLCWWSNNFKKKMHETVTCFHFLQGESHSLQFWCLVSRWMKEKIVTTIMCKKCWQTPPCQKNKQYGNKVYPLLLMKINHTSAISLGKFFFFSTSMKKGSL